MLTSQGRLLDFTSDHWWLCDWTWMYPLLCYSSIVGHEILGSWTTWHRLHWQGLPLSKFKEFHMYVLELGKLATIKICKEPTSWTFGEVQKTHWLWLWSRVDWRQTSLQQFLCQCGEEAASISEHQEKIEGGGYTVCFNDYQDLMVAPRIGRNGSVRQIAGYQTDPHDTRPRFVSWAIFEIVWDTTLNRQTGEEEAHTRGIMFMHRVCVYHSGQNHISRSAALCG